ncbi:unnamed protein product [Chrysoparadoxa australica]
MAPQVYQPVPTAPPPPQEDPLPPAPAVQEASPPPREPWVEPIRAGLKWSEKAAAWVQEKLSLPPSKSLREFLGLDEVQAWSWPSRGNWISRIRANFAKYKTNYVLIYAGLVATHIITSPFMIIVGALGGIWYVIQQKPNPTGGVEVGGIQMNSFCSTAISVVLGTVASVCAIGALFCSLFGAGLVFIAHGALREPPVENIITAHADSDEEEGEEQPLLFPVGTSASL